MGKTSDARGVSLPVNETGWPFVDARIAQLRLRGVSEYFQLLVDLDRQMRFGKHLHSDGSLHLFTEAAMAAESPQDYYGPRKAGESPPGDPPVKSSRIRGGGPAHRVPKSAA